VEDNLHLLNLTTGNHMNEQETLVTTPDTQIENPVITEDVVDVDVTQTDDIDEIEIDDNEVGIEPNSTELQFVGDLVKLAEANDKDGLLKRANEIEAGIQKLHRDREYVNSTMEQAHIFTNYLKQISEGDEIAVENFVEMLYENGIDPNVLLGVTPRQTSPDASRKVDELEQRLRTMEQEKKDSQWISQNADKLLKAIAPLSKVNYTSQHLLNARPYLPKKGSITPQSLLVAIHQANPELTVNLISRQPKTAHPTMSSPTGASGASISGEQLAKMSGEELRRWYQSNKGVL
jgi:hypothetical protein